jgi:pilus assembly protein CpaB
MKFGRIAVLAVALVAGGIAALLAGGFRHKSAPAPAHQAAAAAEVLTVAHNVPMGAVIQAKDLAWTDWPKSGAGEFITRAADPGARQHYVGARARDALYAGEPVRPAKLVTAKGSGFLSAILEKGMRAIAIDISATTSAGGFILPNDHVDVILTQRRQSANGGQSYASSIILHNVRVLAIDQNIAEKNGQKVVVGRTATLAATPADAELLTRARQQGTLSLALRSLADFNTKPTADSGADDSDALTVVRFGVASQASPQ